MTIEEAKNLGPSPEDYDTKVVPQVSSTSDSKSSSSFSGRQGYIKSIDCAFDTTEDPRYYKPIPEYEGIHRWDPDFEWTEEEEKAVVKKVCRSLAFIGDFF
jgi:hypothetical protein